MHTLCELPDFYIHVLACKRGVRFLNSVLSVSFFFFSLFFCFSCFLEFICTLQFSLISGFSKVSVAALIFDMHGVYYNRAANWTGINSLFPAKLCMSLFFLSLSRSLLKIPRKDKDRPFFSTSHSFVGEWSRVFFSYKIMYLSRKACIIIIIFFDKVIVRIKIFFLLQFEDNFDIKTFSKK